MARLVARVYTQIPGVGLTYNYSSVVTDVILHAMLIIWWINKCNYQTKYIDTEFLYPVLEE